MPGYVPKSLKQFGHDTPPNLDYQSYPPAPPLYGEIVQYAMDINNTPPPLRSFGEIGSS